MRISDWSSDVCSSELYWSERAAGRAAPRRSDIDPLDLLSSLLPHLLLINVERDPPDFRYRLAGTAADTIHGSSEERRVGTEWCSTFRSGWSPYHYKLNIAFLYSLFFLFFNSI